MRARLTVGLIPLKDAIGVRFPGPQPISETDRGGSKAMFKFIKKYKERISQPFLKMFPENLSDDVKIVTKLLPVSAHQPHEDKPVSISVDSKNITIYSRIYKEELEESQILNLSQTQKLILSCIYTRHHDGFIREKYLKNLLADQRSWTVPFVVRLLGEYVVEIIELVEESLTDNAAQKLYRDFVTNNPIFWEKTKSRIVNYWYVYYRDSFMDKRIYPGMQIIKIIEGKSADRDGRLSLEISTKISLQGLTDNGSRPEDTAE